MPWNGRIDRYRADDAGCHGGGHGQGNHAAIRFAKTGESVDFEVIQQFAKIVRIASDRPAGVESRLASPRPVRCNQANIVLNRLAVENAGLEADAAAAMKIEHWSAGGQAKFLPRQAPAIRQRNGLHRRVDQGYSFHCLPFWRGFRSTVF